MTLRTLALAALFACLMPLAGHAADSRLTYLRYNHAGLVTDVGVGLWAWPLPMDYNGDGLMDLVVVSQGRPYNGTYVFENTGAIDPTTGLPLLRRGVRIGKGVGTPQVSYVDGRPVVTSPGKVYPDFLRSAFAHPEKIPAIDPTPPGAHTRAKQWRYVDFDGDGRMDLVLGIDFWTDYGAVSPKVSLWTDRGVWKSGPLRGDVFVFRNTGTNSSPVYARPVELRTNTGAPVEVYGQPSPSFGDFDGDGDLDLICGEFTDGFTYFENVGTRRAPVYAPGRELTVAGIPLTMDLCMITPVAVDFNGDGKLDLVVGQEDGRVALLAGTGKVVDGMPQFLPPRFFRQPAGDLKFGVLSTPCSFDLDGDGRDDLVVGDSAGYIGFIRNLGGNPPRWAAPVYLAAGGKVIREQAGPNGSIQGPAERKWGYSNVSVADWDGDGLPDLLELGIWGRVTWYRNVGTRIAPRFAEGQPVEVAWPGPSPKPAWIWWQPKGRELVTQWRSTPLAIDLNHDGLTDLVTLDLEGYLAFYARRRTPGGSLELLPPRRIFDVVNADGQRTPLRLSDRTGGGSGRRTFCFADWDGDGRLDLLVNGINADFYRNVGTRPGEWVFRDMGPVDPERLTGHNTAPTVVDWGHTGVPDVLIGAEDGFFHYLRNPRAH
ncbi:MAG TPA: FG-GAP-like repeat-containing protein [Opitutaceae bacterium]|nr:FG-GAP-like repeat-containing protein [Opitutaceae bacterium]